MNAPERLAATAWHPTAARPVPPAWSAVRRVLAVRLDQLGDVLMTTPALAALHSGLPQARITLLGSPAAVALAPHLPDVETVIGWRAPWVGVGAGQPAAAAADALQSMVQRLAALHLDAAVIFGVCTQSALPAAMLCLQAGIPLRLAHARENPYALLSDWVRDDEVPRDGMRHEVQRQLDLVGHLGLAVADTRLRFELRAADRQAAWERLQAIGLDPSRPYVLVHPGASAASRRWPAERFGEAASRLARAIGATTLFVGSEDEAALVQRASQAHEGPQACLVGVLGLGELGALIAGARQVLCNNSAPAHLAAALGTPAVVLYAQTNPQHTPWQARARVLQHEVPCRHCLRSTCPQGHHACLLGIDVATAADAALSLQAAPARACDEPAKAPTMETCRAA